MKRKGTGKGIMAIGSMRKDGITTYMKQGYGGLTDEGTL